jgi:hypothetical protein
VQFFETSFEGRLNLEWRELGGPAVKIPRHNGFGSQLLSRALKQFDGSVELIFDPAGRRNLQNQRNTRCNKSDWSSFSKQSSDQLLSGRKGSAYWPTIFQAHMLIARDEAHDNFEASSSSRTVNVRAIDHKPERFSSKVVVAFEFMKREMGVHVMGRGLLLWLLGIPLPIILLVWLLGGLHG